MENEENAILFLCVAGYLHSIHFVYYAFAKHRTKDLCLGGKKIRALAFSVMVQVKIWFYTED